MLFAYKFYLTRPFELLRMYREFGKNPKKSAECLENDSFEKLKKLCIYCGKHVPYYKRLFSEIGFAPEKMRSYEDFKRIPVLDKDIVREHAEELQSDEISKMTVMPNSTSGSTGTPLHFYLDTNVNMAIFCKLWRMWNQSRTWHIGKVMLSVGGENPELADKEWWFNPKIRFLYFITNHLKKDNISMYYNLIRKYKPAAMCGLPSAIYLLGKYLEEGNLKVKFDTIFVHSENLLDYQKQFLEKFYGARVVNQYGNNEKAGLIHSCGHNQLHSQDDYAYHEILDRDGKDMPDGKSGRLVCTNLYNYAMPFLRYDTRDIASFSEKECSCGSGFKVVKSITGRASDVLYTADGRMITMLDLAFWDTEHIEMANIYQAEKGKIKVRIVRDKNYSEEDEILLLRGLERECGGNMDIEICYVTSEEIPRTPAGKVRFILSDIEQ